MEYIVLDGAEYSEKTDFFADIKEKMQFPDYFGNNLDALADCLSERGSDTAVILLNEDDLRKNLGKYAEGILQVFEDCAESNSHLSYHTVHDEEE